MPSQKAPGVSTGIKCGGLDIKCAAYEWKNGAHRAALVLSIMPRVATHWPWGKKDWERGQVGLLGRGEG